jgi:hypothetical protein
MNANSLILKVISLKLKKQTFNLHKFYFSNTFVTILPNKITSNKLLYLPKYKL